MGVLYRSGAFLEFYFSFLMTASSRFSPSFPLCSLPNPYVETINCHYYTTLSPRTFFSNTLFLNLYFFSLLILPFLNHSFLVSPVEQRLPPPVFGYREKFLQLAKSSITGSNIVSFNPTVLPSLRWVFVAFLLSLFGTIPYKAFFMLP